MRRPPRVATVQVPRSHSAFTNEGRYSVAILRGFASRRICRGLRQSGIQAASRVGAVSDALGLWTYSICLTCIGLRCGLSLQSHR
jgi:hypothetical protein